MSEGPTKLSQAERKRLRGIKNHIDPKGEYIGESLAVLRVFEKIEEYNKLADLPVLILGETGVGKTEIARLITLKQSERKTVCRRPRDGCTWGG